MSKTPGQRAYEAAPDKFGTIAWARLAPETQAEWEVIAAAVTAPEPKSYGQVCHEATRVSLRWDELAEHHREDYEAAAQAVIAEARKRGDL